MASPQSPKTVNNILTVLNVLLRKAVEWEAIERMPCSIKLLPVTKGSTAFHDFDEYERLIEAAQHSDPRTHLMVLFGGDAGLRCGEMIGAPARSIQELAGHQDLAMTQRYMHLSPAALDAAIRLIDGPVHIPSMAIPASVVENFGDINRGDGRAGAEMIKKTRQ